MRTTVTPDPDVERLFKQAVRATGKKSGKKFVQKSFPMGAEPYFRWNRALATAEGIEDEEISRKLALGK